MRHLDIAYDKASAALKGLNENESAFILARLLIEAFGWDETVQGHDYWEGVSNALSDLQLKSGEPT